jgi:hypothetical protein
LWSEAGRKGMKGESRYEYVRERMGRDVRANQGWLWRLLRKTEKLKTETLKWDRKGVLQRLKCCIVTMGNGDDSSEKEKAESRKQKARKHESRSW